MTPVVCGFFFTLAAIICAVTGLSLMFPDGPLSVLWIGQPEKQSALLAAGPPATAGLIALAPVMATAATGAFRRRRWSWVLAIVIFAANGLSDLARAAFGGLVEGVIGVAITVLVLGWLTRPKVRAQFRAG